MDPRVYRRWDQVPKKSVSIPCWPVTIILKSFYVSGQEDTTIDSYEGIKVTPFNMKEELEEGHFDKDGMYIFDKTKV
jgi:hypothetical protein